jgi:hypothetical protein
MSEAPQRKPQFYDPYHLVEEIEGLLRRHGLDPRRVDLPDDKHARLTAAFRMLRAFDVIPARSMDDHVDLKVGDRDIFRDHGEPAPGYEDGWLDQGRQG